jgi:hypothetical protein
MILKSSRRAVSVPEMASESFRPEFHQVDEFNLDSSFINSDSRNPPHHRTMPVAATSIEGVMSVRQARVETLIPTPSPRKTIWILLKPEELENKEQEMIERSCKKRWGRT